MVRLFLYYSLHTFKNQIKKLFKTWVAVFFVACALIGGIIGVGVGMLEEAAYQEYPSSTYEEEVYEDDLYTQDMPTAEEVLQIVKLAALGLCTLIFVSNLLGGDKSGGRIFSMADVNLLFSSPRKPQSVLLFKLLTQLGGMLVASLYFIFQIPNLTLNLGLPVFSAVALLLCWFFILAYGSLLQVLSYILATKYATYKRALRPAVWGVLLAVLAAFFLFFRQSGLALFPALSAFFAAKAVGCVPVLGWVAGLAEGAILLSPVHIILFSLLLIGGLVLLVYIIWNIKADFYEDALAKSSETAELLKAAEEGVTVVTRKKPRSRKLPRGEIGRGAGANIFLFKALYNRFRFAKLGIFTTTTITYLVTAVAVALITRFLFDSTSFTPAALTLCVFAFYRSLGNPVSHDIEQASFLLIPESNHKKLFFSLLGGTADSFLDLLTAMLVAAIIQGENLFFALLWLCFAVAVDFYSSAVCTFIGLSIPVSAAKVIRQLIQILFIYFGLIPIAALIAVGYIFSMPTLFISLAAVFSALCGLVFFLLCPLFLNRGRK